MAESVENGGRTNKAWVHIYITNKQKRRFVTGTQKTTRVHTLKYIYIFLIFHTAMCKCVRGNRYVNVELIPPQLTIKGSSKLNYSQSWLSREPYHYIKRPLGCIADYNYTSLDVYISVTTFFVLLIRRPSLAYVFSCKSSHISLVIVYVNKKLLRHTCIY